jgi:toxin ParE1/3/4
VIGTGGVRFSEQAENDVAEIATYIGRNNPNSAALFIVALEKRCAQLGLRPLLGRSRDEIAAGLRSITLRRYVIFYRLAEDGAEIVRVFTVSAISSARSHRPVIGGNRRIQFPDDGLAREQLVGFWAEWCAHAR